MDKQNKITRCKLKTLAKKDKAYLIELLDYFVDNYIITQQEYDILYYSYVKDLFYENICMRMYISDATYSRTLRGALAKIYNLV